VRVAIAVWHERTRPCQLTQLVDEGFDHLAHGLDRPRATDVANRPSVLP
jgi:hypothetical protein